MFQLSISTFEFPHSSKQRDTLLLRQQLKNIMYHLLYYDDPNSQIFLVLWESLYGSWTQFLKKEKDAISISVDLNTITKLYKTVVLRPLPKLIQISSRPIQQPVPQLPNGSQQSSQQNSLERHNDKSELPQMRLKYAHSLKKLDKLNQAHVKLQLKYHLSIEQLKKIYTNTDDLKAELAKLHPELPDKTVKEYEYYMHITRLLEHILKLQTMPQCTTKETMTDDTLSSTIAPASTISSDPSRLSNLLSDIENLESTFKTDFPWTELERNESKVKELQLKLEVAQSTIKSLELQVHEQPQTTSNDHSAVIKQLQSDLEANKTTISTLESNLKEQISVSRSAPPLRQASSNPSDVLKLQRELKQAQDDLRRYDQQPQTNTLDTIMLTQQNQELDRRLQEANQKISTFDDNSDDLKASKELINQLNIDIERINQDKQELNTKILNLNKIVEDKNTSMGKQKEKVELLEGKILGMKALELENEEIMSEMTVIKEENEKLKIAVAKLKTLIVKYQEKIHALELKAPHTDEFKVKYESLQVEFDLLNKKYDESHAKYEKLQTESIDNRILELEQQYISNTSSLNASPTQPILRPNVEFPGDSEQSEQSSALSTPVQQEMVPQEPLQRSIDPPQRDLDTTNLVTLPASISSPKRSTDSIKDKMEKLQRMTLQLESTQSFSDLQSKHGELESKLQQQQETHDLKLQELKETHEQQLRNMEIAHNEKYGELESTHDELDEQHNELREKYDELNNKHDEIVSKYAAMEATHTELTKSLVDDHESKIIEIHQQHAIMINGIHQQHDNEIEALKESHKNELEALNKELLNKQQALLTTQAQTDNSNDKEAPVVNANADPNVQDLLKNIDEQELEIEKLVERVIEYEEKVELLENEQIRIKIEYGQKIEKLTRQSEGGDEITALLTQLNIVKGELRDALEANNKHISSEEKRELSLQTNSELNSPKDKSPIKSPKSPEIMHNLKRELPLEATSKTSSVQSSKSPKSPKSSNAPLVELKDIHMQTNSPVDTIEQLVQTNDIRIADKEAETTNFLETKDAQYQTEQLELETDDAHIQTEDTKVSIEHVEMQTSPIMINENQETTKSTKSPKSPVEATISREIPTDELSEHICEYKTEVDKLNVQLERLSENYKMATKEIELKEKEYESDASELIQLKEQCEGWQKELELITEQHGKCNEEINKKHQELEDLNNKLAAEIKLKDTLQKDVESLNVAMGNNLKLKSTLEEDLGELNKSFMDKVDGLNKEITSKQTIINEQKKEIEKMEEEKKELETENKKISGELQTLEDQLDDILQRNMELQMRLAG